MKTQITDLAVDRIRQSNRAMAKIMIHFNRGQWSIEKWLKNKDPRLTEPPIIELLKLELGLTEDQIIEQKEVINVGWSSWI